MSDQQQHGVRETLFQIPDIDTTQDKPTIPHSSLRKTNHSVIVYGIAGAFLGLIAITAFTLWLSFYKDPAKVADHDTPSSSRPSLSIALLTGGETTPATQSLLNKETKVTAAWLQNNFEIRPGVLNPEGLCLKKTICDDTADPDQDGLINLYEYNYGVDPNDPDTDKDGLIDTVELFVYYSNPKQKDSDADIANDFEELKVCTDPIQTVPDKMLLQRRSQIASDLTIFPYKQPTLSLMKGSAATDDDIKNGYWVGECGDSTSDSSSSSSVEQ